ncbi:MAG: glycosyltransferase family 9 protein [Deltaproteobacteria bacterium]|nr:glycosyltransferase family 9 protein [Deltaproteobacteria bacterium]
MKTYVYKSRLLKGIIFIIDAVGYLLKWVLSIFKKRNARQIERILIVKLDHAGDVLLATPAIKAIRKQFPSAHITLVAGPWSRGIVEGESYINDIISYNAYWHNRSPDKILNISEGIDLIRTLRQTRYDIFFDLKGDLFAIIIGFLSGIPRRIGYGWSGGGFLLTDEVETTIKKHQVEILMDAVRIVDPSPGIPQLGITVPVYEDRHVRAMMREEGWDESKLMLGFHVGSGCPSKIWPVERFADLMERVYGKLKAQIVVVGGSEDIELIKRLEGLLSFKPIVMADKTTFEQTAAVIKRCSLFIGNDSVPVHIAAAVEVPVVVLFSAANDWQRWGPYGNDVTVVYKDVPCKGCEKDVCESMECMDMITVDEVFDLISRKINLKKD